MADLGLGVMEPTDEILAAAQASVAEAVFAPAETAQLPAAVNLIPYMSSIRFQASRGTCVAFALTAMNEYVRRRRGIAVDLSEQHPYYEIKQIDGAPNGCGTWQAKAVLALQKRAVPRGHLAVRPESAVQQPWCTAGAGAAVRVWATDWRRTPWPRAT